MILRSGTYVVTLNRGQSGQLRSGPLLSVWSRVEHAGSVRVTFRVHKAHEWTLRALPQSTGGAHVHEQLDQLLT